MNDILTKIPLEPAAIRAPDISTVPSDWKDAASWTFEAFMLHNHTQTCKTCASVNRWSEAFRLFVRRNPASIDRRMVPATAIPEKLCVIVSTMPLKEVPLCWHCLSKDRIGEVRILVNSEAEWTEAQRRDREAHKADGPLRGAKPYSPPKALEDLL